MSTERPAPTGVDATTPSTARIYDYYLDGHDNYAVDRVAAGRMVAAVPESVAAVRANRAFLIRAVRYLAGEAGIAQFLDIGSGLPTQQNVHEVAREENPAAHTVYVDYDPGVRAHGDALLADTPNAAFAQLDVRRPRDVLTSPTVLSLIDFDRPVGLLMVAILQFLADADDPVGVAAELCQALAPGSYVVVSHIVDDPRTAAIADIQRNASTNPWTPRPREEILRFFNGFQLVEPGLVPAHTWHPAVRPSATGGATAYDRGEGHNWILAGVARHPEPARSGG